MAPASTAPIPKAPLDGKGPGPEGTGPRGPRAPRAALLAAAAFCSALALYLATLCPTFSWGDSADLALRLVSDDGVFRGSPRDYALWRALGQWVWWLSDGVDVGLLANLYTAFWGAVAVAVLAAFTLAATGSAFAAWTAALTLAVSHTFWLLSVTAEVYSFQIALLLLLVFSLTRWRQGGSARWLWLGGLFWGLSIFHRALVGASLAWVVLPFLWEGRKRIRGRDLGVVALACLAGASLWVWSGAQEIAAGQPFLAALGLEPPSNPLRPAGGGGSLLLFAAHLGYNFPGLALPLGAWGLWALLRQRLAWAIGWASWGGLVLLAGSTSSIPDHHNVYVLAYPVFAYFVGVGALRCRRRWRFGAVGAGVLAASLTLTPPLTYGLVTAAAERLGLDLTGARPLPYRDNNRYFLFPPKNGDRGARRLATELLAAMPPGAVLIADYTLWRPLLFLQRVEQVRPDVEVVFVERLWGEGVDRWIARQGSARRVFLATDGPPAYYQLERVRSRFCLRRWGWAVEVVGC